MPIVIERRFNIKSDSLDRVKDYVRKLISLKVNMGIGIFYE